MNTAPFYNSLTKQGRLITVDAYVTFEGNPVMRLQDYRNWEKLPRNAEVLVKAEINWEKPADDAIRLGYGYRLVSSGKVDAYRHWWLSIDDYKELIKDFNKYGDDYLFTFELKRK